VPEELVVGLQSGRERFQVEKWKAESVNVEKLNVESFLPESERRQPEPAEMAPHTCFRKERGKLPEVAPKGRAEQINFQDLREGAGSGMMPERIEILDFGW